MTFNKSLIFIFFLSLLNLKAQTHFTQQDSLRGSITPERAWWDVTKNTLDVTIFPNNKSISGSNTITYKVIQSYQTLQLELQAPLVIDSILQDKKTLKYNQKGYSYFVDLQKKQIPNALENLTIFYHGKPQEAKKAPWDGGLVWQKDPKGSHFIASANQQIGASVWWPCKDHPADEMESAKITITCPNPLMNVSNGRSTSIHKNNNNTTSYTWEVTNPINNYGISINIANYANFSETYKGLKGDLDCNYFVLKENVNKAKKQFKDVPKMLTAFEYWFGPYPFYKDSYKMVETPYLGMEHQSCVAYGNNYENGYLGKPMGDSKWGSKFDFIIIHESGHEWFANSISCQDVADMWIHEAFTTYSESLFLDYHYGTQAANEYVQGIKSLVRNDKPIIGAYNVHNHGSSDMYFKGSLMLHTLRQIVNDDDKWRNILLGINKTFYHKAITGQQMIDYINQQIEKVDLEGFFDQYLKTTKIPQLSVKQVKGNIYYKWTNVVANFNIPIKIYLNEKENWLQPKAKNWKKIKGNLNDLKVDKNFYVQKQNL